MNINLQTFLGVLLPLLGTILGAAAVFLTKKVLHEPTRQALLGFAAGVMLAASVWSLLLPALDLSSSLGALRFLPAAAGLILGAALLFALERLLPRLDRLTTRVAPGKMHTLLLALAVTLHNLPEGMAVGVVFAALRAGSPVTPSAAFALSLGIALQNLPEGAIISMPLHAHGAPKPRAFFLGVLSGVVEPLGALVTLLLTAVVTPLLPYLLSFAAGAMLYVVSVELIPEAHADHTSAPAACAFLIGFLMMMCLDVAL